MFRGEDFLHKKRLVVRVVYQYGCLQGSIVKEPFKEYFILSCTVPTMTMGLMPLRLHVFLKTKSNVYIYACICICVYKRDETMESLSAKNIKPASINMTRIGTELC